MIVDRDFVVGDDRCADGDRRGCGGAGCGAGGRGGAQGRGEGAGQGGRGTGGQRRRRSHPLPRRSNAAAARFRGVVVGGGSGNPEPGMARQRHNIGFMAIDVIARRHGLFAVAAAVQGRLCRGHGGGGEGAGAEAADLYERFRLKRCSRRRAFFKIPPGASPCSMTSWTWPPARCG